jgi:DNA polymerase (family 10)
LSIKDLRRQLDEIDELNLCVDGITVFKGIESDILPDGSLDYPPEVLKQLDFVMPAYNPTWTWTGHP